MKTKLIFVAKWIWFVAVVLIGVGFLLSGLSRLDETQPVGADAEGTLTNASSEPAGSAAPRQTESETSISASVRSSADPSPESGAELLPADSLSAVIQQVNRARANQLEQQGLPSSDTADWMAVCRRMSLALVGSGMSLEEIRHLQSLPEATRESVHLQQLFEDPRFHHYWAERWTRFLVGADEGPFVVYRRRRFRHWLAEQIAAGEPYDKIVRELVTAEGLWTDQPEVNFLTVTFDSNDGQPDPIRLAARTSRAFLGMRIDCLQCHNDFLGNVNLGDVTEPREGLQSDFHQLAAFFSSAKTNGLQGIRTGDADYHYQYLDATEETTVEPAVPFAPELLPKQGDARSQLAGWITHPENRQFARAAVVRFWALMFGRSPTDAVDNLPLDEPLPPMLRPIVDDFQVHRDIRRTLEIIARSDAFRLSSRAPFDVTGEHEDAFAVFPLTRLRAEQVAGAIAQAARVKSVDRESSFLVQLMKYGSINDFLKRYGDLGENEFSQDAITIPQRLVMLNGKMLRESSETNPVLNATGHINLFARENGQAIETVYLCVLNRFPSDAERQHFLERWEGTEQRGQAIEDLFWTLANTTEFAWNH
ncbi:DUF1549 domain-containing protein [Roseiconus nitratireducens]|uniref:DUF1549 domain-containing protein n=1 Tax=Roseiconus nitratireducens TaxID=2605748 RepID=A0A5M6DHG9_9BACT|nr:DUF1549 domain-containing protein [Roseiconus nitratireducens]KAA5546988.1 DUF1549 domain-containing protein [Roseiconus nitratireducens]